MPERNTMSENRFADCKTVESVLWHYHELAREGFGSTALDAPAVARIAELTRPDTGPSREHVGKCLDFRPSAPAVELDADELSLLAELLTKWSDVALNLSVDIDHRLPIGYGCIRNRDTDGAWVLRIGGGDE
jgi:hypothetical protein